MKLAHVKTDVEYVKFGGGLDLVTPALSINPGRALSAHNYEAGTLGSFRRIDGYERTSGQPAPSDAAYYYCQVNLSATVAVGETITGSISGATGVIVVLGTTDLAITKLTGTFLAAENFTVGALVKGYLVSAPVLGGYPTGLANAEALAAAADNYRADIAHPAGSGAVRGLALLRGVLYCFKDNAAGTAGLIYKETTAGWVLVTLYKTISFTSGSAIADGAAVTQATSGATAVVKRQVVQSGDVGTASAVGQLILSAVVGTFNASDVIQVASVTKATAASLATQIAIAPGGRYEFDVYNFTGSADTIRVYGADGVNKGFEFDGDVYVPIATGMVTDTPLHVRCHKKALHLTFRGSFQSSAIGKPYVWSAVVGASEIGLGDTISGMLVQAGEVLAIATRNSTSQLTGSSVADFVLDSLAPEVGAIPYTMQNLGVGYWLDDRGVIQITRTQAYGNFDNATVSHHVQPLIDAMRQVVVASTVYKSRNQYRLYGSDGTGICMTLALVPGMYGPITQYHFTTFAYPVNVSCTVSGEDANGKDVVYFGTSDGGVYQADRGSSFDGTAIEAFVRTPFNPSKGPNMLKSYRRAEVEMTAVGYSAIRFHPEFSYGDPAISSHPLTSLEIQGGGGYWDISSWEQFYYDSAVVASPEFSIAGDGKNMGLIAYSNSAIDRGHELQGIVLSFSPRRILR